jgi:hypothetical protein
MQSAGWSRVSKPIGVSSRLSLVALALLEASTIEATDIKQDSPDMLSRARRRGRPWRVFGAPPVAKQETSRHQVWFFDQHSAFRLSAHIRQLPLTLECQ